MTTSFSAGNFDTIRVLQSCNRLTGLSRYTTLNLVSATVEQPTVAAGQALVIWTADLLAADLPDEQRHFLISQMHGHIQVYGDHLSEALEGRDPAKVTKLPVAQLGVADHRFVVMTGVGLMLDICEGGWLEPSKAPPALKRVLYDLARLFTIHYQRLTNAPDQPG